MAADPSIERLRLLRGGSGAILESGRSVTVPSGGLFAMPNSGLRQAAGRVIAFRDTEGIFIPRSPDWRVIGLREHWNLDEVANCGPRSRRSRVNLVEGAKSKDQQVSSAGVDCVSASIVCPLIAHSLLP